MRVPGMEDAGTRDGGCGDRRMKDVGTGEEGCGDRRMKDAGTREEGCEQRGWRMRVPGMEDVGTGDGDASMPGLPPNLPARTPELGGCPPRPQLRLRPCCFPPPAERWGGGAFGGKVGFPRFLGRGRVGA